MKEHENTFDQNNLRDFIDAFIAEKRKDNDSSFTVRFWAESQVITMTLN